MRKFTLAALTVVLAAASINIGSLASDVGTTSDSSFSRDVLSSKQPVVVDFYADWCGPCHRMAPVVDQLSNEYGGRVRFVRVNIDSSPNTAQRYGISSIPTFGVFKNGRMVGSTTGDMPKQELAGTINRALTR